MKPTLLVIDDQWRKATIILENQLALEYFDVAASNNLGDVSNGASCDSLLEWLCTARGAEETRTGDLAVILDLRFSPHGESYIPSLGVEKQFNIKDELSSRLTSQIHDVSTLDPNARGGLAVLLAIARSPWVKRAAVMLASTNPSHTFLDVGRVLTTMYSNKLKVDQYNGMATIDPRYHAAMLQQLRKLWYEFTDFHDSPWVNTAIRSLLDCISKSPRPAEFLHHDDIEDKKFVRDYQDLAKEMFGLPATEVRDLKVWDPESLKALFQCRSKASPNSFQFEQWITDTEDGSRKLMSARAFKSLISACTNREDALRFEVREGILQPTAITPSQVRLPVMPGFTFITAFRGLIDALRNQPATSGRGILRDAPITLRLGGSEGGMFRLSIPLTESDEHIFGLALRWTEKVSKGQLKESDHSVCSALWSLALAKVGGVKGRPEVKSQASGKPEEELEANLCDLFKNGPGRPVVAIGFAPHRIHLYWS